MFDIIEGERVCGCLPPLFRHSGPIRMGGASIAIPMARGGGEGLDGRTARFGPPDASSGRFALRAFMSLRHRPWVGAVQSPLFSSLENN
jgi:hypothetical protein